MSRATGVVLMCVGDYSLNYLGNEPMLPFCWYQDISPQKADFRDDGLVYLSGHKTRADAEGWAIKEGILDL